MGHYDCPGCGQYYCTCPKKETLDETLGKWIIDRDFNIIKSDTQPWIVRLKSTLYKTKKQAENAIPDLIRKEIADEETRYKERIAMLNNKLCSKETI